MNRVCDCVWANFLESILRSRRRCVDAVHTVHSFIRVFTKYVCVGKCFKVLQLARNKKQVKWSSDGVLVVSQEAKKSQGTPEKVES